MSQRKIMTPKINKFNPTNIANMIRLTALITSVDRLTGRYRTDAGEVQVSAIANNNRPVAASQIGARREQDSGRAVVHVALYEGVGINSIEPISGPDHLAQVQNRLASNLWSQVGDPRQADVVFVNA